MNDHSVNHTSILTVERVAVAAAILFFLVMVGMQLNKRLQFDEVEWPPQAMGILRHGVPVIYFGEDSFVRRYPYELIGESAHWGLWHPPLYLYTMATVFAVLGSSTESARFLGVLTAFLTIGLTALLARQFAPKREGRAGAIVALALVLTLTSPFFIQGILYLDIDNTILMPLVLFFLYLGQRFGLIETLTARRLLVLSLVFTLTLWAKLTTPLLLLAALGASYAIRRRWRAAVNIVGVGVIGSVMFAVTWLGYAFLAHVPADFPIRFTFLQKAAMLTQGASGLSRPNAVGHLLTYLTPPFAVLTGIAAIWALSLVYRKRSMVAEWAWAVAIALVVLPVGYTIWVPAVSGKYKLPMVPMGAVLGAYVIVTRLGKYGRTILLPALVLGVICLLYYAVMVPDLYFVPSTLGRLNGDITQRFLTDPRLVSWALSPLPLLVGPVLLRFFAKPEGWLDRIILTALVATVTLGVSQNIKSAVADYSPLSFSVQPKFYEAVDRVSQLCDGGIVLAPKDIGYYLYGHCRVIPMDESEIFVFRSDDDMVEVLKSTPEIRWSVDSLNYPSLREYPKAQAYLATEFDQVDVVGDFKIYGRRVPASAR
ncbi:MAG: glycosyltransferase family 39 protein [Dehalococcoidia bacterium]|nr:glycosyltransferase family 39 protein [Dehalococcoidia bacterium]